MNGLSHLDFKKALIKELSKVPRGVRDAEIADRAGIDASTLSTLKASTGRITNPKIDLRLRLAIALADARTKPKEAFPIAKSLLGNLLEAGGGAHGTLRESPSDWDAAEKGDWTQRFKRLRLEMLQTKLKIDLGVSAFFETIPFWIARDRGFFPPDLDVRLTDVPWHSVPNFLRSEPPASLGSPEPLRLRLAFYNRASLKSANEGNPARPERNPAGQKTLTFCFPLTEFDKGNYRMFIRKGRKKSPDTDKPLVILAGQDMEYAAQEMLLAAGTVSYKPVTLDPFASLDLFLQEVGDVYVGGLSQTRYLENHCHDLDWTDGANVPALNKQWNGLVYGNPISDTIEPFVHPAIIQLLDGWYRALAYIDTNTEEASKVYCDLMNTHVVHAEYFQSDFKRYWQDDSKEAIRRTPIDAWTQYPSDQFVDGYDCSSSFWKALNRFLQINSLET
jgi:hypothetical protein